MALTTVRSTGISSLPSISGANLTSLNASNISSGTLNSARFSGGKIAQVVSTKKTPAANSTTGTSFVSPSGASVNITPSATSSKILVSVQGGGTVVNTNATVLYATIYRDSTNLASSNAGLQRQYNNSRTDQPLSMEVLDSPNSNSQITYAIYYRSESNGQQVYMQDTASGDLVITAMEVLA
jgi:hypothetical protein